MLVKVHIALQADAAASPETRAKLLEEVQGVSGLSEINRSRYDRYGLLTGVVEGDKIDRIRALNGIRSVEQDKVRYVR